MSDRGWRKALVEILKADGWERERFNSRHEVFQHATKPGSVPVPYRLNDRNLALSIARRQAGIKGARL
jgi:predicted RNA binding protein YcfA (HicA-like mRNA interferase family)